MSIILASKSKARQDMLLNAGLDFQSLPANLDEEKVIEEMSSEGASSGNIAVRLAKEKALFISRDYPEKYVIGSDQILSMDEKLYSKARDKQEAIERLLEFQGKTHFLTSAVCVVKGEEVLWHKIDAVSLKMKALSRQDIEKYSEIAGDVLISCVGCYAIEGAGIRLFEDIRGDYFTIMGMPLLPLLNYLDQKGVLT